MKERPILFSAPMVRAILDGRKTQTRRVVKPQHQGAIDIGGASFDADSRVWAWHDSTGNAGLGLKRFACPYGVPGDRLWVKETWAWSGTDKRITPSDPWYRATHYKGEDFGIRWRPSIHMPRWASRITLEVVSVRVERLQEISEADAIAEGCGRHENGTLAVLEYSRLWDEINGRESWAANPWVWVVEFKRLEAQ